MKFVAIEEDEMIAIGDIANYYGGLCVGEFDGDFYWCIPSWDGEYWEKISESLYLELIKHNEGKK